MTNRLIPLAAFVAALAFAGMPFVTSFSGFDPSLYPVPQDEPPAQPAGWAFSIWGVIYLWLIVSTGYGLLRRADAPDWAAHRPALLVSLAIGVAWLPIAEVSPVWATILIWVMLLTALYALLATPARDLWLLRAPVGLYAGWLTAASSVSLALLGAGYDLAPLSQVGWALAAILLALVIAVGILISRQALLAYGAAVIWALVGIIATNGGDQVLVTGCAAAGALLIAAVAVLRRA